MVYSGSDPIFNKIRAISAYPKANLPKREYLRSMISTTPAAGLLYHSVVADGLKIIPRGAVQGLDLNHPRIFGPQSISFVSQNNINSVEFAMCPSIPKGFKVGNAVNGTLNNILGPQTIATMSGIGYSLRRNPVFPTFEISTTFGTDNYNPREIIAAREA